MTDDASDTILVAAAFADAAKVGWSAMSLAEAARTAGLDLAMARARMPSKVALLLAFGRIADQAALSSVAPTPLPPAAPSFEDAPAPATAPAQEQLFDMLMRRLDVLQAHRGGMLALLRALPLQPLTACRLMELSLASMRWLLTAAGISASGAIGAWRAEVLLGAWLWTVRRWAADDSPDLSATMATLDTALARAVQLMRL